MMETNVLELSLQDLIMVTKPYNILEDIKTDEEGNVIASVKNEYLMKQESGPMQCSEFGRHAAILGSMLLAKNNTRQEKHYYLAIKADLTRNHLEVYENEEFTIKVSPISQTKRAGSVYGELFDSNDNVLFTAEVGYMVLNRTTFQRLNANNKIENILSQEISPYKVRKRLRNVFVDENKISATYGVVNSSECEGHFENYPCLPVAIVGGLFGDLAVNLLEHVTGCHQMIDKSAVINAKRLAFAGEFVHFEGKLLEQKEDNTIVMFAQAFVGDEVIADVTTEVVGV
ncbi:hypothetical protein [Labilibacter marinus]|uniref:hypothetical protein n=1 Tax=Labilibacter marinus TaxID=1477105 RepID=UPI00082C8418|nr:hypothetical protein [Labilibacter marinus]